MTRSKGLKLFRICGLIVVIVIGLGQQADALQGIIRRLQEQRDAALQAQQAAQAAQASQQAVQQAEAFAQQALDAIKAGDLPTAQQRLHDIDTLGNTPSFAQAVVNSPKVQEARQAEQTAIIERQAKERAMADRRTFEEERARQEAAQHQEDARKTAEREQTLAQVQRQESAPAAIPSVDSPHHPLQAQSHQDGAAFAASLAGSVREAAASTHPQAVPRFQEGMPKEASLDGGTIGDAALAESRSNAASQALQTAANERPNFKVDPTTDPLLVAANQAIGNPQQTLNEEVSEIPHPGEGMAETLHTCEEGGEEYQQSCTKRLEVTLTITPHKGYRKPNWCFGHRRGKCSPGKNYCNPGCVTGEYVTTQHRKVVAADRWVDGCAVLESLTEQGLCRYEARTTSPQNETRVLSDPATSPLEQEAVTRDHFEEYLTYTCFKAVPSEKSCKILREKGCWQIASSCAEKVGDACILWTQTYSCPSGEQGGKQWGKSYRMSNKANPFCLTGNCVDTSYEANTEMMNVMGHLYALREAQEDLRNLASIFKGQRRWCSRNCLNFRDCCGSSRGWGVALKLSSCDAAEIELRTLRDKNLCVQVGTYCAERERVTNMCLRKKTSFCCYGTKLARLVQESGRAQLGMGFGTPEHPDCEGFTPDHLSRIDFSQVNFSEVFQDIRNQTVVKGQQQSLAGVSAQRLQENMERLTKPPTTETAAQEVQALKDKGL